MKSVRVLIADPDCALTAAYAEYLGAHGFVVAGARTALDCVDRLRRFQPDVLVLDPDLPWGWGDGVLAVMRDDPTIRSVPVLVITRGANRAVLYSLGKFHIDDFESKPISSRELARRIRALVPSYLENSTIKNDSKVAAKAALMEAASQR